MKMVDWKEIEQLQAELQKTQQSVTHQRLSERNCIEILMKLEAMKLIDVLHSCDGKEYLTPSHLIKEIRQEVHAHGGRINVVDLQSALNVDLSEVEQKCTIVAKEKSMHLVFGQLVNGVYLDQLAEEINDVLESTGHVTLGQLSKLHDLPRDFLSKEVASRMGKIIHGKLDSQKKDIIYTDAFITKHKHRIRGILSAVTRPIPVSLLCHKEDLSPNLASMIIEQLIREGRIKGHVTGTEGSQFIPAIYSQSQNSWVDNFFKQNDYLEYDAVSRLGIIDARPYLQKRLAEWRPIFFKSLCVGRGLVDQLLGHVEETLNNNEWSDVTLMLPSSFSSNDIHQLLDHVIKQLQRDAIILCDVIVTGRCFVESCLAFFDELIKEKCEQKVTKVKALSVSEEQKKEVLSHIDVMKKSDKKEERRRKALEGSGSSKRSGDYGGSGLGGREVRTKGADKKKIRWQKEQDAAKRKSQPEKGVEEEEIMQDEVEAVLRVRLSDCPDEMREEIAEKLVRPLNEKVRSSVKSVFLEQRQSEIERRPVEDVGSTKKSRKQLEEEVNRAWTMLQLLSESLKFFTGIALTSLHKHLLQTVGTSIVDCLFLILAREFLPEVTVDEPLSEESRLSLLARFPTEMQGTMARLNQSLMKKTSDLFCEVLPEAFSPSVCDVRIKNMDKKKTRQLMHGHKMALISKLQLQSNPSLCFHLCVVIVFQSVTGILLDVPGKLVPSALQELEARIDQNLYAELYSYEQLVMKSTTAGISDEERSLVEEQLQEGLPRIKELATIIKKKQST